MNLGVGDPKMWHFCLADQEVHAAQAVAYLGFLWVLPLPNGRALPSEHPQNAIDFLAVLRTCDYPGRLAAGRGGADQTPRYPRACATAKFARFLPRGRFVVTDRAVVENHGRQPVTYSVEIAMPAWGGHADTVLFFYSTHTPNARILGDFWKLPTRAGRFCVALNLRARLIAL